MRQLFMVVIAPIVYAILSMAGFLAFWFGAICSTLKLAAIGAPVAWTWLAIWSPLGWVILAGVIFLALTFALALTAD